MSVTAGTVRRPTSGRGDLVVVRTVQAHAATVAPWPQRGRRNPQQVTVALNAAKTGLQGYTATGQRG